MSFARKFTVSLGIVYLAIATIFAGTEQKGIYNFGIFQSTEIDTINNINGNLFLHIPIAQLPVGPGGQLQPALTLYYNSKLWKTYASTYQDSNDTTHTQMDVASDPDGGWRYGLRYSWHLRWRWDDAAGADNNCESPAVKYSYRSELIFPDGSSHALHPRAQHEVDGFTDITPSGLRLCGLYNPAPSQFYTTDGTAIRIEFTPNGSALQPNCSWVMYFPDGRVITDDGNGNQTTYDANGNHYQVNDLTYNGHPSTAITDQVGRQIVLEHDTAAAKDYIHQTGFNGQPLQWTVTFQQYAISKQYDTGDLDMYGNEVFHSLNYPSIGGISQIQLPSQMDSLTYLFTYDTTNNNGELKSVTFPSGARNSYGYLFDTPVSNPDAATFLGNKINAKSVTYNLEYDGTTAAQTDTTIYAPSGINPATGLPLTYSSITYPDGSAETDYYLAPLPYNYPPGPTYTGLEGLPVKNVKSNGVTSERIWRLNKVPARDSVLTQGTNVPLETTNPFVKTEFTSIPDQTGTLVKTAIKDYDYDKNGNITAVREYDYVPYNQVPRDSYGTPTGLPSGITPLRTEQTSHYYSTPDSSDTTTNSGNYYANGGSPNLKNLVADREVINGAGAVASKEDFTYDGTSYPAHGNLTERRSWDSTKGGVSTPLTSSNSVAVSMSYDSNGNATSATDANGNVATYTFGSVGGHSGLYPTQTVTASGTPIARTSQLTYDFNTGALTEETDVDNGVSKVIEYDALGRPTKVRSAYGTSLESWEQTTYNDSGRYKIERSDIDSEGDARSVVTTFYDQLGQVRLVKTLEDASTQSATNETDGIKVQTREKAINGYDYRITSNPYRAATSGAASSEETMGWTRTKAWADGHESQTETFAGSALPTPWGSSSSSTGVIDTTRDANSVTVTDQAGKVRRALTNAMEWLVRVDEPTTNGLGSSAAPNQPTVYSYDVLNNLIGVSQGAQTRTYSYSSLSRLSSATNPESGVTGYAYDDFGNLISKTDARGVVTNYSYDALSRVTQRSYAAPSPTPGNYSATPTVSYTYDDKANAKGKLTRISSSVSTEEFTSFDTLGRVTSSKQTTAGTTYGNGTTDCPMTYAYNLAGALVQEQYPSCRVVKNILDATGDLSIVESKKNQFAGFWHYADNFKYNAAGSVTSMQLGNNRWESTTFNSRLQPTQIGLGSTPAATDQLSLGFTYNTVGNHDNNGNILTQTIVAPAVGAASGFTASQSYGYDELNRLSSATETIGGSQTWKQAFSYDQYGNRSFVTGNTSTLGSCTTMCNPTFSGSTNRITSSGDSYDSAGNVVADPAGRSFVYDAEKKQTTVSDPGGDVGDYSYDGDGKRVTKIVPSTGEMTIFVYDAAGKTVAEYSTSVADTVSAKVNYETADHLGSPRLNTDASGRVIARHDYMPFGEEIATSQRTATLGYTADSDRRQFTSQERDTESNLDYFNARYFSSISGRFTTADEYGGKLSNPKSLNLYSYALNNPLRWIDPSGHSPDDPKECGDDGSKCKVDPGIGLVKPDGNAYKLDTFYQNSEHFDAQPENSLWDLIPVGGAIRRAAWNSNCDIGTCDAMKALGYWTQAAVEAGTLGIPVAKASFAKSFITELGVGTAESFSEEVTEETLVDAGTSEARTAGSDASETESLNGNSQASTKSQHLYEIVENDTGAVRKTGVSGGKVSKSGVSYRATSQVNKLNKAAGYERYSSRIVNRVPGGPGARSRILQMERNNANLHRATLDPLLHRRP